MTVVDFSGAAVEITLALKNEMKPRVTTDSRASIGSLSLLGEPVIDISPSPTGTPLKDGDFIQPGRAQGQIADVAASASAGARPVDGLSKDIRAGKGSVGKLFTDEELYTDIDAFVDSAQVVTRVSAKGKGTLGMLLRDPASIDKLNAALGNLQEMTRTINAGEGSLGRLLKDDALAKSLTSASGNVDQITGRAQPRRRDGRASC